MLVEQGGHIPPVIAAGLLSRAGGQAPEARRRLRVLRDPGSPPQGDTILV